MNSNAIDSEMYCPEQNTIENRPMKKLELVEITAALENKWKSTNKR